MRTLLLVLACTILVVGCSSISVEPQPAIAPAAEPPTHKVHLLPTVDARPSARTGAGVDVFGMPDLLVRSDADLAAHLDSLVAGKMAEQGLEIIDSPGARPSVQLLLLTVVLRRDPGIVMAHYSGTADLLVRIQSDEGLREQEVVGGTERDASGVRALEEVVFTELLTSTLDDAATKAASTIAAIVRQGPPQELH